MKKYSNSISPMLDIFNAFIHFDERTTGFGVVFLMLVLIAISLMYGLYSPAIIAFGMPILCIRIGISYGFRLAQKSDKDDSHD